MSSYSSLYPGIDHLPMRLPSFDRFGHPWCIVCHGRNGRAVAGDGLCDTCRGFNAGKPEHRRIAYGVTLYTCTRCRQVTIPAELVEGVGRDSIWTVPAVCESCRKLEREPQGESVRLFEPAPTQMPGQLGF